MSDQEYRSEYDRRLADLARRVSTSQLPEKERESFGLQRSFDSPPAHWRCVMQNTIDVGLTDWEPEFFQDTTTQTVSYRLPFRLATAGGELSFPHPNGGATYGARFAKIQVYATQPQTITYAVSFVGASSDIQLKVNGAITNIAGPTETRGTFDIPAGDSTISIATDTFTDSFQFWALLFDGEKVFWVDPSKSKYPSREGFEASPTSAPSSGAGSTPLGGTS